MPKRSDIKSILIIGAGPIVIGQACEFDYSGTQACKALKDEGYRIVLVNSNPATIMRHRQGSGVILRAVVSRNTSGQFPFAKHAGISENLKRLCADRSHKSDQHHQLKDRSHDVHAAITNIPRALLQVRPCICDVGTRLVGVSRNRHHLLIICPRLA